MKKGKVVTILLVIVVGVLMFIIGQYASGKMNYNMFKESEKNSTSTAKKDEPEISKEHKFVKSVSSDVFFSGKKHNLMVYYYKEDFEVKESDSNYELAKELDALNSSKIYGEIYLDNKKIVDMTTMGFDNRKLESINTINIGILQEYKVIKDEHQETEIIETDDSKMYKVKSLPKEYILIKYSHIPDDLGSYLASVPYGLVDSVLVNENGEVLDSYRLRDNGYDLYIKVSNDQTSKFDDRNFKYMGTDWGLTLNYNYGYLDVNDNYMYYLDVPSGCGSETFNEYKITINNGKINKEKTNTYTSNQIEQVGGECNSK